MKNLMSKFSTLPKPFSVGTIILALLLWTNLGVLPILDQSIVASKYLAVLLVGTLLLLTYFISSFKKGSLSFVKTPLTLPLSLFGLVTLLSIFLNNRYPVESLLNLGGVFLALTIIALKGGQLLKAENHLGQKVLRILGVSVIVLFVSAVLQQFGYGPTLLLNKAFGLNLPSGPLFNLAGSNLVALQIAIIAGAGFVSKTIRAKKAKPFESLVLVFTALSIVYYGWLLMPGKVTTPVILSPTASWSIAVGALKNLKTTLIGVGPDNYLQAYNLNKPAWINGGNFWSVQFGQGFNLPLSLTVTMGVFGLISWVWLLFNLLKQTKSINSHTKSIHHMLLASFLLQLFMPINVVLLTIQFGLMSFWIASEKERFSNYSLNLSGLLAKNKFLASRKMVFIRLFIGLLALASASLLVALTIASYSSYLMYKSSKLATANDFVGAYNLQQDAIKLNPYLDSSRRKYAVTNIVIAAALSQKADLNETDKQRFAQLIQQSIRESKAAILLDGKDVANWQLAAQVYQTLIGVAENSQEWALSAYAEAIKLAPNNPELRLVLGGVLFNSKEYEGALRFFEQSAVLKPNYANAYYNGANTLKMLRRFDEAKVAYQKTLLLLQPDSDDYLRAADELQELEQIAREAINQQAQENQAETLPSINPIEDVTPEVEAPPIQESGIDNETVEQSTATNSANGQ